jgi:hypothetical protein
VGPREHPDRRDGPGYVHEGEEFPPLREEDVTAADRLDDRVQEGDGLPDEDRSGD